MALDGVNSSDRNYTSLLNSSSATKPTKAFDAVFEDSKKSDVTVKDFLNLMVAQLANQDFMNPADDTQYMAQLAQFATMEQMTELGQYSKQNYIMSLLGKEVTASKYTIGGGTDSETGKVEKVSFADDEYSVYVNGKSYSLDQISVVGTGK